MKLLRKCLLYLVPLLLLAWACHAMIFKWLVPKTALYTIPAKWNMIPLRQSKEIVHGYFGEPTLIDSLREEWKGGTKGREYTLRIYYGADTITEAFSISYHYQSRLVSRTYLLDTASIE